MEKDLANAGNFPMGVIRDLCEVALLPVAETEDVSQIAESYRSLALHVLDISGLTVSDLQK
jgi:hypothetical protein